MGEDKTPEMKDLQETMKQIRRQIREAFIIPPKILYAKFRPFLIVDNTKHNKKE